MSWVPAPPSNPTSGLWTPLPDGVHSSTSLVCTQALVPKARRAPRWGSLSDSAPGPQPWVWPSPQGPSHDRWSKVSAAGNGGLERERGCDCRKNHPTTHTHTHTHN